ncbi:MAG: hypothetical protein DBX55_01875 [Verrucomicrobia bacterium]|nr:MAG: hypothetical protein DBX55_01875 [Verrucomicrobiota bacterium]
MFRAGFRFRCALSKIGEKFLRFFCAMRTAEIFIGGMADFIFAIKLRLCGLTRSSKRLRNFLRLFGAGKIDAYKWSFGRITARMPPPAVRSYALPAVPGGVGRTRCVSRAHRLI